MGRNSIAIGLLLFFAVFTTTPVQAQHTGSAPSDSTQHDPHRPVYHINYWIDAPIIAVGAVSGAVWLNYKNPLITDAELNARNVNDVPSFDRISLHQNIGLVPTWDKYASAGQLIGAAMPVLLLADPSIRADWLPVLTLGLEANMAALIIFTLSPLGPRFIDRYRPLVYYTNAAQYGIDRNDGINKNSFYSGHVASVTTSAFFMAKVYCDYHPDANPYIVYALAAVPSLGMGVIRFMTLDHFPSDIAVGLGVGIACGVLVPQLHRVESDNLSMGFYSSPEMGTGLALRWRLPDLASR